MHNYRNSFAMAGVVHGADSTVCGGLSPKVLTISIFNTVQLDKKMQSYDIKIIS